MIKNVNKRYAFAGLFTAIISILPAVVLYLCIYAAKIGTFGDLPDFQELENPETNLATEIISIDNNVIGTYFYENRTHITYEEISPHLINALIATEDERFLSHSGIDFIALARVARGIITGNISLGGGSTITQQLAKMFFSKPPKSKNKTLYYFERIKQKFKEWVIATRIERQYSKQEIVTMYLNRFDFLNLAVGVKSAAQIYFNTSPDRLTIEQAATLVGMAKNPSLYNPVRRLKKTEQRRNIVLNQMAKNNYISSNVRDSLILIPLVLEFKKVDHNEGQATYFREHLRRYMTEWSKAHEEKTGKKYNIYKDGLKIYTTIDSRMQAHAEHSIQQHIKTLQKKFYNHWEGFENAPYDTSWRTGQIDTLILIPSIKRSERYRKLKSYMPSEDEIMQVFNTPVKMSVFSWKGEVDTVMSPLDSIKYYNYFLHSGLISIEPSTGHIKAWVGGVNHKYFKYDHVKDGKRQVGSTFKPFVYATAIDQFKYSPCLKVPNIQVIFEKDKWQLDDDYIPENANKKYGGELTLTQGLAQSKNTISAYLMKRVGPRKVISLARKMGITSYLPPFPSLCLGTAEVSLFEMTGAYTTFANEGLFVKPIFVYRIEDKNGVVLEQFTNAPKEVLSQEKNYIMVKLLQGVINEGSGGRLRWKYQFKNEIAGKTGTTQNHSDGWFIGFVPNLVTGVWTGADNRSVRFRDLYLGQGAEMALPIWGNYMQKLYAEDDLNISTKKFKYPEKGISVSINCNNNQSSELEEEF